tara:strand:+ start:260 stop:505 length:246 start_codon:yes stop_codon:yes gene_type:complete
MKEEMEYIINEEEMEYINQIPPKDELDFCISGIKCSINREYKDALFSAHPHYTIEEIVGTHLGHNPWFPSYQEWQEINGIK